MPKSLLAALLFITVFLHINAIDVQAQESASHSDRYSEVADWA